MDAFRITLIVTGVLILLGIYIFDSKKKIRLYFKKFKSIGFFNKTHIEERQYNHEPSIDDESDLLKQMDGVVASPYIKEQTVKQNIENVEIINTSKHNIVPIGEEMVIVLFIMANNERYFTGVDIDTLCKDNGFIFSEYNIYEKFSKNVDDNRLIAKIVNSFEPGTFHADTKNFDTKAITVLMFLSNPDSAMLVFDEIVTQSKNIAKHLGGDLCDESRSVLTPQTINHLKEKIKSFQFKAKMSKTKIQLN